MPLPAHTDTRLWLVLLHEIEAAGGKAPPTALYPRVTACFPEITPADLAGLLPSGDNKWRNRVRWVRQALVERGCIDGSKHGVWAITPLGAAWLHNTWRGPHAD
jgi:restriction system protein